MKKVYILNYLTENKRNEKKEEKIRKQPGRGEARR